MSCRFADAYGGCTEPCPDPLTGKPACQSPDDSEVPCELCGDSTSMTATKRCNRCWELETRIQNDLDLALKIIANLGKQHAA